MAVVVIPVGVTKETVSGLLSRIVEKSRVEVIVVVSTPGYESVKKDIIETLKKSAELLGAGFEAITIGFADVEASTKIYRVLRKIGLREVYVSLITGSRYLIPIMLQALLKYAHSAGARVYAIHGIEGESYSIEPLIGFTAYTLIREQRRLFKLIYMYPEEGLRTKEDLIEKYGFSRSVYKVLRELEEKGLIIRRRNKILKTFPGKLLYNLLREVGEI